MPAKDDKFVYPISTLAGIKRDGTSLDGNYYSDGQWCRFRNGRPKKIGGYRELINLSADNVAANYPTTPLRGLYPIMFSPDLYLHAMHGNGITLVAADQNGVGGSAYDRTPAGWTADDVYSFSAGALYSSSDSTTVIVVHGAPDLADITDDTAANIYYGIDHDTGALLDTTKSVSGGCCILGPYVFAFGSNGEISNCDTNQPTVWTGGKANRAFVAATKIVAGMVLRGGANSPAGLFWSLAELIRVSFVGGTINWRYDTLTDQSSILAKNGVVEYDGSYYWPGIDRFLMYNGVLKEIPNPINQDFFYDNVNMTYRNKIWGMRIARWGEIWWFFPKYPATECNWAIVFNVREGSWYDTPIDRASGFPARELPLTLMTDAQPNTDTPSAVTGYRIYRHEIGVDRVVGDQQTAIRSYFETSQIGFATGGPSGDAAESPNVQTKITRVEQDFVQVGDMEIVVTGSSFAQNDEQIESDPVSFPAEEAEAKIDLKQQRRLLRLRFTSNVQGGDYMAGKILCHLEPGDERP